MKRAVVLALVTGLMSLALSLAARPASADMCADVAKNIATDHGGKDAVHRCLPVHGQSRAALAECAWKNVEAKYPQANGKDCVKPYVVNSSDVQDEITKAMQAEAAAAAAPPSANVCRFGCTAVDRCEAGCPPTDTLPACDVAAKALEKQLAEAILACFTPSAPMSLDPLACGMDALRRRYPRAMSDQCIQNKVKGAPEVQVAIEKVKDEVVRANAPPPGATPCRTRDPATRQCVCGDAEYTEWRVNSTYEPHGVEAVAVQAFLTPLTFGLGGFTAPHLISLIKQISSALKQPHCFARLNAESSAKLGAEIQRALGGLTWQQWGQDPCGVPARAWRSLGAALHNSEFYKYIPDLLRPPTEGLWLSTEPIVCALGKGLWEVRNLALEALKSGVANLIIDKALSYALGVDTSKFVLAAAHTQLGTTALTARYAERVSEMASAIGRKDVGAYERAKTRLRAEMLTYLNIDDGRFIDLLGPVLKQAGGGVLDKLKDLVKSKLADLTKATIDPPLKAAKGSIASVPYVGGLLVTVLGYAEDYGIGWVYGYILDQIETPLRGWYEQGIDAAMPALRRAFTGAGADVHAGFAQAMQSIRDVKAQFDRERDALRARINQNITDLDHAMAATGAH